LVDVKSIGRETTLCLAAAHALVRLEDGSIVGDPMEKTTLQALDWSLTQGLSLTPIFADYFNANAGDSISPANSGAPHRTQIKIRRRFQFSSALKRMSTISTLPGGKTIVSVKGAPETIKGMLSSVPGGYDETYKWFTRRGSRVLALGIKEMDALAVDKVLFDISLLIGIHIDK
jgi:cation-transporting ATPase 13A1